THRFDGKASRAAKVAKGSAGRCRSSAYVHGAAPGLRGSCVGRDAAVMRSVTQVRASLRRRLLSGYYGDRRAGLPRPGVQWPPSTARPAAKRTDDIDPTLLELSENHGVSDEQLAKLTGCSVEEIVERRARAWAKEAERAAAGAGTSAGSPAAPVS